MFLLGNLFVILGKNYVCGYVKMEGIGELKDIMYYNLSLVNVVGDMIFNVDDLNKFFLFLFGGKLLKECELKEMFIIVFIEGKGVGDVYGFGIYEIKFLNGVLVWGYGGGIFGFIIFVGGVIGGKYILVISFNFIGGVDIVL